MQDEKDVGDMPIWQDHERRITTLENTFAGYSTKMDSVEKKMGDVERKIDDQWGEQKQLLNTLIEHHLSTNKIKLSNFWKMILNVTGAGGLIITVIYALVQYFGR
ncbi:hypothetical protein GCM10011409_00310 [Lentibacillus populi]|uniref:Uncharacterized protein n=1 Tax=Lentibacillus populi TaxID=1827502 RepID=A0A9W5TTG8_9BACI|nr:hypothetical protein [Lentibacillus populi]GGB26970.1 hypothetical protein GCM10011409_00310 [Lentibacillus populi]